MRVDALERRGTTPDVVLTRVTLTEGTFRHRAFSRLQQLTYLIGEGRLDRDFYWAGPASAS